MLVEPFLKEFREKVKELDLTPDQIYNADETGLFYKVLPNKTLVSATEATAPGRKISKERITFLACTNASGMHKIKPLVIGKSLNPRAFQNYGRLPVVYKANKNAWMTLRFFEEWFHDVFVPEVRIKIKCSKSNMNSIFFFCLIFSGQIIPFYQKSSTESPVALG